MPDAVAWLALLDEPPASASRAVPVSDGAGRLTWLCAWHVVLGGGAPDAAYWRRPSADAVRVDPDVLADGATPDEGPSLVVAWTVPMRRARPLHDDPAVVAATRRALRDGGGLALCTAAVADTVHWAGGLSAVTEDVAAAWPGWRSLDPWRGLAPTCVLGVPPGVLRPRALPPAPGLQRRAGAPWPAGTFATAGDPTTGGRR
ncbi:hypothetical protein [Aquipuribacter nitratireducens]|uniref:Uncharacterized protein n=1 Tax=Aquipuribacter nitratireducens TaxID=650104 RepID=A0ABW0GHI2_9MICO